MHKKNSHLPLMALTAGMIILIRPTDAFVLLFPLIFGVSNLKEFKKRVLTIIDRRGTFLLSLFLFSLPILTQMLIWKIFVGKFIHYSYHGERFFFNDPQIFNFLFSYRRGWLVYSPIMIFTIVGIILSYRRLKSFFPFLVITFCLNVYVLSCWWDWAFGGSFGCRPLIEFYAFLIFPLAVFIKWFLEKLPLRSTMFGVFLILISLNIFQTWQYKMKMIHWVGMSKELYWFVFLKTTFTQEEVDKMISMLKIPNGEMMFRGENRE